MQKGPLRHSHREDFSSYDADYHPRDRACHAPNVDYQSPNADYHAPDADYHAATIHALNDALITDRPTNQKLATDHDDASAFSNFNLFRNHYQFHGLFLIGNASRF